MSHGHRRLYVAAVLIAATAGAYDVATAGDVTVGAASAVVALCLVTVDGLEVIQLRESPAFVAGAATVVAGAGTNSSLPQRPLGRRSTV